MTGQQHSIALNTKYWEGFHDGIKAQQERQQASIGAKLERALMGCDPLRTESQAEEPNHDAK